MKLPLQKEYDQQVAETRELEAAAYNADGGWAGMSDWLGTGRTRRTRKKKK